MTSQPFAPVSPHPQTPTVDHFLMCRNDYHVTAHGATESFDHPEAALTALREGRISNLVGALPFDVRTPAALVAPEHLTRREGAWSPAHRDLSPIPARVEALDPAPAEHRRRVAAAIAALGAPAGELHKVVLARGLRLATDTPVTPWEIADRLRAADPAGTASVFVTDLSPAGGSHVGAHLVGASPEILVGKRGPVVYCHPLAGSAARHPDPAVDAERARDLAGSSKDRHEHRFVVAAIAEALAPLCDDFDAPESPEVFSTPAMWHLGTRIRGVLKDPMISALELALAVHPTPAVCGTPTLTARDYIADLEGDRGFYAGAVGWCRNGDDPALGGDGEWLVAIRCAELAADGRHATAWAGGGIVAASDPAMELGETTAKFATMLSPFDLGSDRLD